MVGFKGGSSQPNEGEIIGDEDNVGGDTLKSIESIKGSFNTAESIIKAMGGDDSKPRQMGRSAAKKREWRLKLHLIWVLVKSIFQNLLDRRVRLVIKS